MLRFTNNLDIIVKRKEFLTEKINSICIFAYSPDMQGEKYFLKLLFEADKATNEWSQITGTIFSDFEIFFESQSNNKRQ